MNHFASYFNAFRILPVCAILCAMTSSIWAADPVVSNIFAVQRPGTKLVDITYDVTADTPTVGVTLRISSDGGATFDEWGQSLEVSIFISC